MEYPEEVKITSFSPYANAYRNMHRYQVDELFSEAEDLVNQSKNRNPRVSEERKKHLLAAAKQYNDSARQLWRKIVTVANTM